MRETRSKLTETVWNQWCGCKSHRRLLLLLYVQQYGEKIKTRLVYAQDNISKVVAIAVVE